jgi:hypothetical protein
VKNLVADHYRCPEEVVNLQVGESLSGEPGFFRVTPSAMGYGRCLGAPNSNPNGRLADLASQIGFDGRACVLPFDLKEVIANLRLERYPAAPSIGRRGTGRQSLVRQLYYAIRPLLPVALRRHLQRAALGGWQKIPFPRWPVDASVDVILSEVLLALARQSPGERIPFIWFWPRGYKAALMMTHDVETAAGRDFCSLLMDMNDATALKSSFQLVPEERYPVPDSMLDAIRSRGFEIGVHGLNHDGTLFNSLHVFESRIDRINAYGRQWGARGFRSPVLYRNPDWYHRFEFEYDMTIPNVAHLDPQRGGCATVMPYFIGHVLELPLTTIQDYSLFHILGDYSISLWRRQAAEVIELNGLVSFNIHPDYLIPRRARSVYEDLLRFIQTLRDEGVWCAPPGEINNWWRLRAGMRLDESAGAWSIEGEGSEDAVLAYAVADGDCLQFQLEASICANSGETTHG